FRLVRLTVGTFYQDADAPFGFVQLLPAVARQRHTFFKQLKRLLETCFSAFELRHDRLQPGERLLKAQLFFPQRLAVHFLAYRHQACPPSLAEPEVVVATPPPSRPPVNVSTRCTTACSSASCRRTTSPSPGETSVPLRTTRPSSARRGTA